MAPKSFTLPAAKTASAQAARSAFYCELCRKGYGRMNEYEAHESSYDHQHKKRLKDMKEMQKNVQNSVRREESSGGGQLMSIKLGGGKKEGRGEVKKSGFKKGTFKNAFGGAEDEVVKIEERQEDGFATEPLKEKDTIQDEDSDVTDQEDYYDPRKPTGCLPGCAGLNG